MRLIQHIIEPTKLLLAWQSSSEEQRRRYIVGQLERTAEDISLTYLIDMQDFREAKNIGFTAYPAFQETHNRYFNVLGAFMRRLPPRSRGDFPEYLKRFRIEPNTQLSDFALLGYSGAKLPSDGFSIIHPFNNANGNFELLLEAAGFRHQEQQTPIKEDEQASFSKEEYKGEEAVSILVNEKIVGYVNRGLLPTFLAWMKDERIIGAWVEKINGTPEKPSIHFYLKISATQAKQ